MINDVQSTVIWLTGMSGAGKSTLSSELNEFLSKKGCKTYVLDGDDVRDRDAKQVGYDYDGVMYNNTRIANLCLKLRESYDVFIVPVISPYADIRKKIKILLDPNFFLVYVKTDIKCLRKRDTKGLYSASDKGIISNLIGYSKLYPYEEPDNADLVIDTSESILDVSKNELFSFVRDKLLI